MSWASDTLTQVQTAITNIIAGGAVSAYSINGRAFSRENLSELLKLRATLQQEVARENSQSEFLLADLSGAASYRRFSDLGEG